MTYHDKTVLVACHGLFASVAQRLARDFGKVYLYVPYNSFSFPHSNHGIVGLGLPGVERVDSLFGKHFEEVDLFVFPDLYLAQEQIHLESLGKRVWGARNGEELELYRETCKETMEKLGLPVNPWKKITGIKALREHLKAHDNQFVKFDKFRGNFETFQSESYALSEPKLDRIASEMGAYQHVADFIVEDELPDCVEIGTDLYCIDGQLPSHTAIGIEVKDLGYVCQFLSWQKLPEPIRRWNEQMAPVFARYGYRGWLSNEIRICEDHTPYMIDATCRQPCPPGELLQEYYLNYCDILWHGADGILIDPIPAGKFGMEVILSSDWARDNWQPVEFDPQWANQVKLFNPVVIEGKSYVVPQDEEMKEIGAIVAWGETLEEAEKVLRQIADSIKGYGLKIPQGSIDEARQQMKDLSEFGLPVFSLTP
jgi:hypothetical protein